MMGFAEDFIWGVATASYQIEGAPRCVGGGESVWDMFCRRPGAVFENENGDVACDHYNRYKQDVQLMSDLGYPNYRLSLSWPRIMPEGTGRVLEEGLSFYDKLVDELLSKGIEPHVTLFHWDMPLELYYRGGWLNRDSADWFADYTSIVVDRLSDRVTNWMTLNEPQCFIGLGLQSALHAPGDKLNFQQVLLAGHHALLAHGKAVQVIRAKAKKPAKVGWAPVGVVAIPETDSPADLEAARRAMFNTTEKSVWSNAWWSDPVYLGHYPEDALAAFGDDAPKPKAGDMETISTPIDFYGANIYNGRTVKADENGDPIYLNHPSGIGRTIYHWPVTPDCLYWGPRFLYERYGKPIVVTENGIGISDWVALDGKIHDPQRIDYLHRHLLALRKAADDGSEIAGYFQWSFMDNFEWYEGYKHRFGLVYVDYATQQRIPKDSAHWYTGIIKANGNSL